MRFFDGSSGKDSLPPLPLKAISLPLTILMKPLLLLHSLPPYHPYHLFLLIDLM